MPFGTPWIGSSGSIPIVPGAVPGDVVVFGATPGTLADSGTSITTTLAGATNSTITTSLGVANAIAAAVSPLLNIQGNWNASTNTPTLADGTGTANYAYIVNVAGTQDLGHGDVNYNIGDIVYYATNNEWNQIPAGNDTIFGTYIPIISVNGGATGTTAQLSNYVGTGGTAGISNQIIVVCSFTVDVDSSGDLVDLSISPPVGAPATAQIFGLPRVLPTGAIGIPGNIGAGAVDSLIPDGLDVRLVIECAQINISYTVTVGWIYGVA